MFIRHELNLSLHLTAAFLLNNAQQSFFCGVFHIYYYNLQFQFTYCVHCCVYILNSRDAKACKFQPWRSKG